MNTNESRLLKLIQQGEGLTVEFKECQNSLNRDVYETVCAFLNRHGGTLLLGVNDSGVVTGVSPDCIIQIKKDFVTSINNTQKINPACYLSIDEVLISEKTVLRIYVPESSQVHRCNNHIFDRNEDGDLNITNNTRMVADLYQRKQSSYSENKIYPFAKLADFRKDLIARVRKIAGIQRKDHPWLAMNDLELMKSAQLYQTDFQTGQSGFTMAGILLLGTDETILSVVPHHRTDLILRRINLDRYDDRDDVRTNLIESYDRIMAFIAKHLPDPFYLEGDLRISLRDAIFREVASNILIHREYMNPFPAKLIIERDQVRTENSNKPHGFGVINPTTFSPFPKNPVMARFFKEIGRADELGSGVRNLMKYGQAFGGRDTEMVEGDVFRIRIGVKKFEPHDIFVSGEELGVESGGESGGESKMALDILGKLQKGAMSKKEIAKNLGKSKPTRYLNDLMASLLKKDVVAYTIPDKPKSRLQKYRLTAKGLHILVGKNKN